MGKVLFEDANIQFYKEDKHSIFNCSHCGQMGNEAPVRSKTKQGKLSTYHEECAQAVIYRINHSSKIFEEQVLNIPKPNFPKVNEKPKSYLKPVEDEELERKKAKLKAILHGDRVEAVLPEVAIEKEKVVAKPKAKIEMQESGNISITHKYDQNLVDKYHFIKEIKWNSGFKYWECNIKNADYETCRFFFKIHKEIPRFDWLISDEAFKAVKARIDWHENQLRKNKEIKELKEKKDINLDLSFMKMEPYPYQKVGIAFLNKIHGLGMVGDSMGLGKCQSNQVLSYGSWGYLPMEDIFNKYKGELFKVDKDGGEWYYPNKKIYTYSINKEGSLVKNLVPFLYRQKVETKLKKILLQDGNETLITQPHKLLTLKGWTNSLKEGDYLLVPRKIEGLNSQTLDLRIVKFMSWLISEGDEKIKSNQIGVTQNNKKLLLTLKKEIIEYSKDKGIKINQPRVFKDRNTFRLRINSKEFVNHLKELGYEFGYKSAKKSIPNFILKGSEEEIKFFLRGYFEAEGSVSLPQNIVEIATASEKLMNQLVFLCRRLGIWLRYVRKQKMATNGLRIKRSYCVGFIGGTSLRSFKDLVGFESREKIEKLKLTILKETNDNVDIIPTLDIFQPLTDMLNLPASQTGIEDIYWKNQNCSRGKLEKVIRQLKKVHSGEALEEYLKIPRSKWTDQVVRSFNQVNQKLLREYIHLLEWRLNANANYCKIRKIELVEYNEYVYDLSVNNDHNYISNNMYAHNTIQAIGYTAQNNLRTVIVCPASLKYNWKNEIAKFTNKTAVVLTEYQAEELSPKNALADYIIINYEQLEKYSKYLLKSKFDCVILDESQYIMNLQAKRTKLVFKLFKKVEKRMCLSGTPIKNRPIEFYSQLKFLRPDQFSNKMKYALRYCDAKETPFGWDMKGASNLDELNRKIAPFYIRRLKQEVLKELPPKTVTVIETDLNVTEKNEYLKIKRDFERFMKDNWSIHGVGYQDQRLDGAHLAKLMELKMFCSQTKVARVIEFVKEFVEASENRKIIVFSQFIHTQKMLRDAFPGISVSLLGEDAAEKRQEAVERFQSDPKIRVFVGSTIAAGVGLTLTAADTVIFADLMWSPADHQQAEDRAHRISQENPVFVYYMIFKETIEEMIWKVIGRKLSVIEQTLDGKNIQGSNPDVAKTVFSQMLKEFKDKKDADKKS